MEDVSERHAKGISEGKKRGVPQARPVAPKRQPTYEEMMTAPPAGIFEVRVGQAAFMRQAANDLFEDDKIEDAMKLYERALFFLDFEKSKLQFEVTDEHKRSVKDSCELVYLNLARCCLKQKKYREAIKHCRNAPHKDSQQINIAKSKYLQGKAYLALEDFPNAVECLQTALIDAPSDRAMHAMLATAKEGLVIAKKQESEVWGGAMKRQLEKDAEADRVVRRGQLMWWGALVAVVVGIIAIVISAVVVYTN